MEKQTVTVSRGRAILCTVLAVIFTALTVFQFSYHGALSYYRAELAATVNAMKAERDAAVAALTSQLKARDDQIAALTARADALAARLVGITGSEEGTAEDCLRRLIAASLSESDKEAGYIAPPDKVAEQVEAYMNTYAADALAVAERLLFIDYLYRTNYLGEIDAEEAEDAMTRAYIAAAGDVYGVYYSPEEYEEYRLKMQSSVCGIGCIVGRADGGRAIELLHVHSQSAAAAVGLISGDLIRTVDGDSVEAIGYDAATARISGEAGTSVTLGVERNGATLSFTVERKQSEADVVISRTYEENGVKIGYIRILNFTARTYESFVAACETAEKAGAEALIFDLRDNGGGLLTSILDVLDWLLPKGTPLASYDFKNTNNARPLRLAESEHELSLPMYVLQNKNTASAAELFCSVLGKNGATLIGTETYGKGTMQTGYLLENGAYVTVSVALYAPGDGENYEGLGVLPTVSVSPEGIWAQASVWKLPFEEDLPLKAALQKAAEEA